MKCIVCQLKCLFGILLARLVTICRNIDPHIHLIMALLFCLVYFNFVVTHSQRRQSRSKLEVETEAFRFTRLTSRLYVGILSDGYHDPRGGTLRIFGCGCAARILEPLAYTRASFSWILLPYTRVNSWFPWSSQPTGQFREK